MLDYTVKVKPNWNYIVKANLGFWLKNSSTASSLQKNLSTYNHPSPIFSNKKYNYRDTILKNSKYKHVNYLETKLSLHNDVWLLVLNTDFFLISLKQILRCNTSGNRPKITEVPLIYYVANGLHGLFLTSKKPATKEELDEMKSTEFIHLSVNPEYVFLNHLGILSKLIKTISMSKISKKITLEI